MTDDPSICPYCGKALTETGVRVQDERLVLWAWAADHFEVQGPAPYVSGDERCGQCDAPLSLAGQSWFGQRQLAPARPVPGGEPYHAIDEPRND